MNISFGSSLFFDLGAVSIVADNYYCCISSIITVKSDIKREGKRDRKLFHPLIPKVAAMTRVEPIQSEELLPSLPHGCSFPRLWASNVFPGYKPGTGWEGGFPVHKLAPI